MQMRDTEHAAPFSRKNSLQQQLLMTREELHSRTPLLLFKIRLYMEVQWHGDSRNTSSFSNKRKYEPFVNKLSSTFTFRIIRETFFLAFFQEENLFFYNTVLQVKVKVFIKLGTF